MSDFRRKSSMENYKRENALKVARRNEDTLKASLKDFDIPFGSWEHRSDQSGEFSSTKEQLSMKNRESVKLKDISWT